MGDVVNLPCVTTLDLPPNRILDMARDKCTGVIVIGYTTDGAEYFASSYADGGDVLWLLERAKLKLLRSDEVQP